MQKDFDRKPGYFLEMCDRGHQGQPECSIENQEDNVSMSKVTYSVGL